MSFFESMNILSSGMSAERIRINTTTSNMANAQTTRTDAGGPYKRRDPVFLAAALDSGGFGSQIDEAMQTVNVTNVEVDQGEGRRVFNPKHPDADPEGYVMMPNVVMIEEMVNMMTAQKNYEAQITAMHHVVGMAEKALGIGR